MKILVKNTYNPISINRRSPLVFVMGMLLLSWSIVGVSAVSPKPNIEIATPNIFNTMADKIAIRELVDTFAILADKKDIQAQVLLFTENAQVTTYTDKKPQPTLVGRDTIGKAFSDYLALFDTVYHMNGQQVTEIKGDSATSTLYGQIVLIRIENGRSVMQKRGVIYHDQYVKHNQTWLIDKRDSHFVWSE